MATPASSSAAPNIILGIHEKKTNSVEIYRPLCQFIAFHYSEREAQNLEDDLQAMKQMRSDLKRPSDSPDVRRNLLQNYYKALCVMEFRFPISPDKEHINTITFTWYNAFKQKNKASQQNIHLEKASVLFNLGAVHSQIALSADRSTPSSRMQASHSFMASARAFAFLRDNASMKASIGQSTLDISAECAGMLERLMLAQAQECVFEKVIAEGKSPGLSIDCSCRISDGIVFKYSDTRRLKRLDAGGRRPLWMQRSRTLAPLDAEEPDWLDTHIQKTKGKRKG